MKMGVGGVTQQLEVSRVIFTNMSSDGCWPSVSPSAGWLPEHLCMASPHEFGPLQSIVMGF